MGGGFSDGGDAGDDGGDGLGNGGVERRVCVCRDKELKLSLDLTRDYVEVCDLHVQIFLREISRRKLPNLCEERPTVTHFGHTCMLCIMCPRQVGCASIIELINRFGDAVGLIWKAALQVRACADACVDAYS